MCRDMFSCEWHRCTLAVLYLLVHPLLLQALCRFRVKLPAFLVSSSICLLPFNFETKCSCWVAVAFITCGSSFSKLCSSREIDLLVSFHFTDDTQVKFWTKNLLSHWYCLRPVLYTCAATICSVLQHAFMCHD